MSRKLHIGIIGGMGRGPFIGQMFNQTGNAVVVAVADINPKSFDVGRERFGACGADPDLYSDVAELLKRDDLDWVVVGTPANAIGSVAPSTDSDTLVISFLVINDRWRVTAVQVGGQGVR